MVLKFDTQGNEKQKECVKAWLDDSIIDITYGGSKGSAKTYTGCQLIFGDAFIYPGTHYFIARKKLNDLRKYIIPSIHEVFEHWGVTKEYYKYNGQDNYFELYNGSKVFLIDAKYLPSDPDYTRFGSMQMTRGWIEEAGEFEEAAKNNLQASIGRWKNGDYKLTGKLLQTCNPAKNYLYREYYLPHNENRLPSHIKFIQALPTDNKAMIEKQPDYIPNLIKILSPNEIERLVYGNWEYDDNPFALFDYNAILNIFTNTFVKPTGIKYLSADIAYEGSDKFVIGIWDGMVLEKVIAFDKCDETMVSKRINDLRVYYKIPISNVIYDGDGVKRYVKQSAESGYLKGAYVFHNNGKAIGKENYFNLKAQVYFKLADYCKKNLIFVADSTYRELIIKELEQINQRSRNDDNEKIRLESKKKIRERLQRSPDFADMMAMRMTYELFVVQKFETPEEVIKTLNY